jgi:AcrR family transcriptional regulator
MKQEKLSQRAREKLNSRNKILATALELFSKKGYRNVSMFEIATKAEFRIGTLYNFFNNKEEIFRALVFGKARELFGAVDEVLSEEGDVRNIIKEFIATEAKFFVYNLAILRLYFTEVEGTNFNFTTGFDQELRDIDNKMIEKLALTIEKGIRANVFRNTNSYQLALTLRGLMSAFLFCCLKDLTGGVLEDDISAITDLFFKGCLTIKSDRRGTHEELL